MLYNKKRMNNYSNSYKTNKKLREGEKKILIKFAITF